MACNIVVDSVVGGMQLSQIVALSLVEVRGMSVIHGDKCFRVHDLWREFLKKEVTKSCRWIFKEHQNVKPSWRPQLKRKPIERLKISGCYFEDPTLDLSGIKEIKVLHLIHNKGLERVQLSKSAWSSIQSLIVHTSTSITILIEEPAPNQQQAFFHVDAENCEITSGASNLSCYLQNNPNSGLTLRNVVSLTLQNVRMNGQLGACLGGFQQLHELKLTNLSDLRVNLELDKCRYIRKICLTNLPNLEAISGLENSSNVKSFIIEHCSSLCSLVLLDKCAFYLIYTCKGLESIEVRQSQLENNILECMPEGELLVSGCPLIHNISGLSQRKFIGTVEFENYPPNVALKCSPETVKQMFEISEYHSEQQIRSATIFGFRLEFEGLKRFSMKDVHDTSSHILALACTSASNLESLEICCSREDACGCLPCQPRFDYFKMALTRLSFECADVLDLSSLENCSLMKKLGLYGCLSVVEWPDFGKMTSLEGLEVICPCSLTYWPSGLRSHPSLKHLRIMGSNQIPPEELLEQVTSGNVESCLEDGWLSSWAALEVLVDDVNFSRKDNLRIAKALMSNNDKLLSIAALMSKKDDVFMENQFLLSLSKLLYGLWLEADCSLHECTTSCEGTQRLRQLLQDSLQTLLSDEAMISALLQRCFRWGLLLEYDEFIEVDNVPFESLVLVCFASIEKFGVLPEEQQLECVGEMVKLFFEKWELKGRLPLYLWDRDVPEEDERRSKKWVPWLVEHDLSRVRFADAMCRLEKLLLECDYALSCKREQVVKRMYDTYHSPMNLASHSIRTQWPHPRGYVCDLDGNGERQFKPVMLTPSAGTLAFSVRKEPTVCLINPTFSVRKLAKRCKLQLRSEASLDKTSLSFANLVIKPVRSPGFSRENRPRKMFSFFAQVWKNAYFS